MNTVQDFGQILGVVMQSRVGVGQRGISVPTVLSARAVGDLAAVGRVLRGFEEVLHAIHSVIEKVRVVRTDIDMNLAG